MCISDVHQHYIRTVEIKKKNYGRERLSRFFKDTQLVKISREEFLTLSLVRFLFYGIAFHWKYALHEQYTVLLFKNILIKR